MSQDISSPLAGDTKAESSAILLHDWEGCSPSDVFKEFDGERWAFYREDDAIPVEEKPKFQGFEILLASYTYECYSGDAFVLCRKDGVLYEVNAGHCSCYGLEGQWEPEETTIEALRHRLEEGNLGADDGWHHNVFANELRAALDGLSRPAIANQSGEDRAAFVSPRKSEDE